MGEVKKVLIGSQAMKENGVKFRREIKDIDYLCKSNNLNILKNLNNSPIDVVNGDGIMDDYTFTEEIASIGELYTLKVSHSPWIIKGDLANWYKHIHDVRLLKEHGGTLISQLHDVSYKEWEKRLGIKKVNLNKDTEEFFDNNVKRKYIHDTVHESISFYSKPLFNEILNDKVKVSEDKFNALSHNDKIKLVQEEVMVLSLERDLIPLNDGGKNIDKGRIYESYGKQLCLLTTKYSKNWFPKFIIENYFEVVTPPFNYWSCFMDSDKKMLL